MALASVLSAMKELILLAPTLPSDQDSRQNYIKNTFPALTEHEAEDLAKIDPSKLKIYTNSIFCAERDLILRNFAMTVEYLKKGWHLHSNEPFDLLKIAKELHKTRPWKSTHTVDLCKNFLDMIEKELGTIKEQYPFPNDLAKMELLLRIVRRSPDDETMPKHSLSKQTISAITVEEILNLNFLIPTCVEFTKFNYALINARTAYLSDRGNLPDEINSKETFCALSRNADSYQRWTEFDQNIYSILANEPRASARPVAYLAEKFLEESDSSRTEQELFAEFISLIYPYVENGVLVIQQ